jgi:hypothetical protein
VLLAADLTLRRPEQFCTIDQGIYGQLPSEPGRAGGKAGDRDEAASIWRRCWRNVRAMPSPSALLRLDDIGA